MAIMADRLRIAGILLRNRFHHPSSYLGDYLNQELF
jgi:hypothetical protein